MPVLLDRNSPAGQAELQRQQEVGATITLAMQLFAAQVAGLAHLGQSPDMANATQMARESLVTAAVFLDVANAWASERMKAPQLPPKVTP